MVWMKVMESGQQFGERKHYGALLWTCEPQQITKCREIQ